MLAQYPMCSFELKTSSFIIYLTFQEWNEELQKVNNYTIAFPAKACFISNLQT